MTKRQMVGTIGLLLILSACGKDGKGADQPVERRQMELDPDNAPLKASDIDAIVNEYTTRSAGAAAPAGSGKPGGAQKKGN